MEVDDGSYLPGSVTRALEDGYKIHDRILERIAFAGRGDASGPIAILFDSHAN